MTKAEAKKDPYALEGIDGLGPASIKALNAEGIYSTFQLIHKNPVWLKDVTGIDKDKAGDVFKQIRDRFIEEGLLLEQEMTVTQLLDERKKVPRIQTGCKAIDHLLKGGVEVGSITEIFGENGAGKTQFSHTLAVQVQRPIEEGGLAVKGKAPPLVLYIDTENTMRPERIMSILTGKGLIPDLPAELKNKILDNKELKAEEVKLRDEIYAKQEKEAAKYMDNIIVNRVSDAMAQCTLINNTIKTVQHVPIKLIIVDSGTALFRGSYLGRGNIKSKFDLMNEMIHDLLNIAELSKIAVIFVNQIYNSPTDDNPGQDPDIPYGGNIIGHAVPYRLKVEKSGSKRRMKIVKSPYQANDDVRFDIAESGLVDLE